VPLPTDVPDVDLLPDGRVAVRLVESCGSDLHLSPMEARDLAFRLLRVTMTPVQREVLSSAMESWWGQCSDYGPGEDLGAPDADEHSFDEQLTVTEDLQVALGLRNAPVR
jgi:hypothetical protein